MTFVTQLYFILLKIAVFYYRCDTYSLNYVTSTCSIMKIEEAILYCLSTSGRGMRTEQIAEMINRKRLHVRKDGQSVTSNQVYAVICRYPDMFVKAEGRIVLMI